MLSATPSFLAPKKESEFQGDTREHGVQGQQWGIRRDRGAGMRTSATPPERQTAPPAKPAPKLPPSSHPVYHAPGKALAQQFPKWQAKDHEKAAAIHSKNGQRAGSTEEAAQHNNAAMGHQLAASYLNNLGARSAGGRS